MPPTVPSLEELDIAYDVVTRLIIYYGVPGSHQMSQMSWNSLQLTQRVIERMIAANYGQHRWIEYAEARRQHAV